VRDLPLKPETSKFTDKQWEAIHDTGKNILVSASAGSGKTTVLVNRLIEKIKNKRTNVDELLVVTFTNAAAREMKERIQQEIQYEINAEHDSDLRQHLVSQIPLIGQANISTIHSFCLKVIRRYYYLIDIDPVFRLLTDETEKELMKEDVLEDVLEEKFEEANSIENKNDLFLQLAKTYANDRSLDSLKELVLSLYEFSMAHTHPDQWLDHLSDLYEVRDNDLSNSYLYTELIKPQLAFELDHIIYELERASNLANDDSALEKSTNIVDDEVVQATALREKLGDLNELYSSIQNISFARWKNPTKKDGEEAKEVAQKMKAIRDSQKEALINLKEEYFLVSPEQQIKLMANVKPIVKELANVVKQFIHQFNEKKTDQRVLDFNDLEHLTYDILTDENNDPSEASLYYQNLFEEVMIDEYQDVNVLQDELLKLVSKPDSQTGNQFMVGDVKQSIYGFRLAAPRLFKRKYDNFQGDNKNKLITLPENFRSRDSVLHFTNYLFSQLMDNQLGDVQYEGDVELVNGFKDFPESTGFSTELLIYEKNESDESVDTLDEFSIRDKTEGELKMVSRKIRELIDSGFEIYDKSLKENRPIKYSDIVLLTPTKNNNLEIQDEFKELSIPVVLNDTQNYFRTTEISIIMSVLKIIDNPRQDIPLVAVLRSMIVGLNERELAAIRVQNKKTSYYDVLVEFVDQANNSELKEKIEKFFESLEKWRKMARRNPLVDLIWTIYIDTGFLDYVGGLASGRQRKANLHALYERASSYEETSFKGLFQFIRFIEKMQKKDKDLAEPNMITDGDDAVRVMTIHASKGLEFPIVFILDMSKKLNTQETSKSYIFDEDYGIGTEYFDLDDRVRYSTWPQKGIQQHKKSMLLSEQMRVLYVALTRAEQKLFLIGSYESQEKALKEWSITREYPERVLSSIERLNSNSFMEWIGKSIIRHSYFDQNDYDLPPVDDVNSKLRNIHNSDVNLSVTFMSKDDLSTQKGEHKDKDKNDWVSELKDGSIDIELDEEIKEAVSKALTRMNKRYSHYAATQTTSFQSVSEIKRLFEEPDDGRMAKLDISNLGRTQQNNQSQVNRYVQDDFEEPKFITKELKQPTNVEIGQATHLVLQSIDFQKPITNETVNLLINDLIKENAFTEQVGKKIDRKAITQFFETSFGSEILTHIDSLNREIPFSLMMEAQDIFHDIQSDTDHILIHGIIDGFFQGKDGLVLFDYKTDRVSYLGENLAKQQLIDKYKGQLNLYRQALEEILNEKVENTYILSLDLNCAIELPR